MKAKKNQNISGQVLVSDYQDAFLSATTIEVAKIEAERSESSLLDRLGGLGAGRYLNPGAINIELQTDVTRASLDAHIKKVQAAQLDSIGTQELIRMSAEDQLNYAKRRVR